MNSHRYFYIHPMWAPERYDVAAQFTNRFGDAGYKAASSSGSFQETSCQFPLKKIELDPPPP